MALRLETFGVGDTAAPPNLASSVASLGAGANGKPGTIRVGSYPDVHDIDLMFDATAGKWVGLREYDTMRCADTWGIDLSNYALSAIQNTWRRLYSPLPYGKTHTHLTATFVAGTDATMTVSDTTGIAGGGAFPASGSVKLRDQTVNYTGKTGTTLTGCTGGTGTFAAGNTPVVLTGQDQGGWGTTATPLDRVAELYTAGLVLEERANAWLNGGADNTTMTVATFYKEGNLDEDLGGTLFGNPPTGLRQGVALTGPASPLAAHRSAERGFRWRQSAWTTLTGATPAKRFLIPALYARMDSGSAADNGEVYGYTLRHRWVSA